MMAENNISKAKALNWSEHTSALPKEGVVYPKGQDKADLIARLRKAFGKVKLRQTA
jgi:hypothetical protein